jgi:hypothetical protein
MPIDEDLFSQNIGDLERDKFKATPTGETAVRTDGKISLQSADGSTDVDVDAGRKSIAVHDNNAMDCLQEIVAQLKEMNTHLAEITGMEVTPDGFNS